MEARMASMVAAKRRRLVGRSVGRVVGALSQKRLIKHAINNETFCLSAAQPDCLPPSFSAPVRAHSRESSFSLRGSPSLAEPLATFLLSSLAAASDFLSLKDDEIGARFNDSF